MPAHLKILLAPGSLLCAMLVCSSPADAATNSPAPITVEQLKTVLPESDIAVLEPRTIKEANGSWVFYPALKKGVHVGTAFTVKARGYGGVIDVLVGVLPDGTLRNINILSAARETPDIGSKVQDAAFTDQFKGKSTAGTHKMALGKDGGEIHAVTGATISSRAVVKAVKAGMDAYARHAAEITGKPTSP